MMVERNKINNLKDCFKTMKMVNIKAAMQILNPVLQYTRIIIIDKM